jgi:hypothetical protein
MGMKSSGDQRNGNDGEWRVPGNQWNGNEGE